MRGREIKRVKNDMKNIICWPATTTTRKRSIKLSRAGNVATRLSPPPPRLLPLTQLTRDLEPPKNLILSRVRRPINQQIHHQQTHPNQPFPPLTLRRRPSFRSHRRRRMLGRRPFLAQEHKESDSEGNEGDDEILVRGEATTVEDHLRDDDAKAKR